MNYTIEITKIILKIVIFSVAMGILVISKKIYEFTLQCTVE
jgi:hypothetical protein